ncbi:MAG: hypothetical protein V1917_04225 [Candidatus Gottesmanbacteria bacterium]
MNGNKIVIAILVGALCISAAIYFGGQKPTKIPEVTNPVNGESQAMVETVTPEVTIVVEDDLPLITKALIKKTGIAESNISVTISKRIGDYAVGGVIEKDAVGGAQWFAAKTSGSWVIVHDGQDYPKCSALVGYTFPKEMLDSCWNDTTNTLKQL